MKIIFRQQQSRNPKYQESLHHKALLSDLSPGAHQQDWDIPAHCKHARISCCTASKEQVETKNAVPIENCYCTRSPGVSHALSPLDQCTLNHNTQREMTQSRNNDGVQDIGFQNRTAGARICHVRSVLWHEDYFKLIILRNYNTKEGLKTEFCKAFIFTKELHLMG